MPSSPHRGQRFHRHPLRGHRRQAIAMGHVSHGRLLTQPAREFFVGERAAGGDLPIVRHTALSGQRFVIHAETEGQVMLRRRLIAKSWSTLGSTREAAVSSVWRRTIRPPSSSDRERVTSGAGLSAGRPPRTLLHDAAGNHGCDRRRSTADRAYLVRPDSGADLASASALHESAAQRRQCRDNAADSDARCR